MLKKAVARGWAPCGLVHGALLQNAASRCVRRNCCETEQHGEQVVCLCAFCSAASRGGVLQ